MAFRRTLQLLQKLIPAQIFFNQFFSNNQNDRRELIKGDEASHFFREELTLNCFLQSLKNYL